MKKSALAARLVFVGTAVMCAAIDLATKAIFFSGPQYTVVKDFFYIRSAGNEGGVFGMLAGNTWTLVGMAVLALFAVVLMLSKIDGRQIWMHVALGLVLGGAIGNLYDRIFYYYILEGKRVSIVRDFLDFRIFGWQYPIFNGADVFICIGAAMIFLRVLFGGPLWGKAAEKAKGGKVRVPAR
jgi:signal peptidase II